MKVSIIIVGMNHLKYITALLPTIYGIGKTKYDFEIIYVDNCSTDNSVLFVRENYPDIKILNNTEPLGFGENNNKGVMASTGDIIAIINPDIVLIDNSIDKIVGHIIKKNDLIIAPQLLNPDFSTQYSVRSFITLRIFLKRLLSKGNDNSMNKEMIKYLCKDIDITKEQTVDWAMGAALFMTKDIYAKLGGFDQRYFLYMEDEDMCLRAWKLNIPVIFYPEAKMIHNHLRGSSKFGKKTIMHFKSLYTFFRRHGINVHISSISVHSKLT